MDKKPITILVVNCDWRNIFETNFDELYKKLERDRLGPEKNYFFFISWSIRSYMKKRDGRFISVHRKTHFRFFRPIVDFMSLMFVPYCVWKYDVRPDVILVHDLGFVPSARIVKWMRGGRIVLCLTNMPEVYSRTRKFGNIKAFYSRLIERLFVNLVDVGYTLNETMKRYIVRMGIDEKKVIIFASDTINRDMAHIKASKKGAIRKKYAIPDNAKIILSVGRLEAEKGFPRLLNIFADLDSSFLLIILGQGSLREELQKQTKKLDIEKRVIFAGFADRTEIWDYYNDADVFMLLSNVEALGLVFWEAMYMGVPAIGSTAEGIIESLGEKGERGLIVKPDEHIGSIREKIEFMLRESDSRGSMLVRAKQYVEQQIANDVNIK